MQMKPHSIEERAKRKFGTTEIFQLAGYILPDGEMLNFSYEGYQRDMDHRDISPLFSKASGTEAMLKFMRRGNIRMHCQGNSYCFDMIRKPTREQLARLESAFHEMREINGEMLIEISQANGSHKEYYYDWHDYICNN